MTEEKVSMDLSTFLQKEAEDLYSDYYWTKALILRISGKGRVSKDEADPVNLNRVE